MRLTREIGLPVPVETAWSALTDWEAQARWMKDADRVQVVSPHAAGIGTSVAVKTRVLGVPLFVERLEVTGWDPPHRLTMAHRSWIEGDGTWVLIPAGFGCRFRWTEELALPLPVVGEVMLRIYRPFMARLMQASMWGLRADIERIPR
ncbi:MAG: SRPBCC family protein [Actinomycetota bacterium]